MRGDPEEEGIPHGDRYLGRVAAAVGWGIPGQQGARQEDGQV